MTAKKKNKTSKLSVENLLTMAQLTPRDIELILATAEQLKAAFRRGRSDRSLQGQILAGIFEKSSTRTRVSFEAAMYQLGGAMFYLAGRDLQLGRGETIADTARVLSRYVNGIMIRTDAHEKVVEMAKHAAVPVINALTDYSHPCQILSDLLTLRERFGRLKHLRLAYIGDGNNVARSLIYGAAKTGMDLTLASPMGFEIDRHTVELSEADRKRSGGTLRLTQDPVQAATQVDAVYTDVWVSMGQEKEQAQRLKALRKYQVNEKLMAHTAPGAVFLHCLPAHRGQEVTEEVIEGRQSIVFDQAENRLHVQKAILKLLMERKG
ncbi:MAG: ornithine carbamoyltransferase [candidate division FCPU426 bacterium]